MINKTCINTYFFMSLAFIIVNIITLSNSFPWIDEVMFIDTSYNAAIHGNWETTAWYRVAGEYPFSTYPPLYQMLATVWIWIFGGSLITVRSLNLIITFILGVACLQLMKRHDMRLTMWTTALFTILLWGTSEMAWMYRNGRPDMLNALIFVLTTHAIDKNIFSNSPITSIAVIITSSLLLCSGLQATVYLFAFWLFIFLVMKQRRKETTRILVLLLTGSFLGLLIVATFMLAHGRLVAFVSSILQYSTTLSGIALAVIPMLGKMFGFSTTQYTQKLLELTTNTGLREQLVSILEYRSFLMLSIVALLAYITYFRDKLYKLTRDKGFLLLVFALYVPIIMNLAGRFTIYYQWMTFLPLIVSITYIALKHRVWCAIFCMIGILMTVYGVRSMLPDKNLNHQKLRSFVERQQFKSSDAMVCPFLMFYEIKPICDTCYFAGIFPTEFIGKVDYIIEANDGDEFDKPITDYVNNLKADTTVVMTVIDHCEHPSLTLYQVRKHE